MPSLAIWVRNTHAATLSEEQDQFLFRYTDQWIAEKGFAFSPHLPLKVSSSGATVRHFFSNLLPEGENLQGLSLALQINKFDVFSLLRKIGMDCAGALVLLDEEEVPEADTDFSLTDYQLINEAELNQRIVESNAANTPVLFWENIPRMSLAGVQNKLSVYMDDLDRLYLSKLSAPTSHILKPDAVEHVEHPAIAANEYFCMSLAKAIGLNVPDVIYKMLPTPIYLVKRYDRIWTSPHQLVRSHQIDGCQALNLPPTQKYEREYENAVKGATLQDILSLANICTRPAIAQKKLLEWLMFNYLIGNSDAHAKNISFLINPYTYSPQKVSIEPQLNTDPGIHVAPLYDLVSGVVYGYKDMAQTIGDNTRFDWISHADWKQFAAENQLPWELVQKIAHKMLKKIHTTLLKTSKATFATTHQPIILKIVDVIQNHSGYLSDSLKL